VSVLASEGHKVVSEVSVQLNGQPGVVNSVVVNELSLRLLRVELSGEERVVRALHGCNEGNVLANSRVAD